MVVKCLVGERMGSDFGKQKTFLACNMDKQANIVYNIIYD